MGPDAGQDAIAACEQKLQACFAALAPDASAPPPFAGLDAGFPPFPGLDAAPPTFPGFDAGAFKPPSLDGGLTFPPFPDAGLPPIGFPDGAAPPSSACFDDLNKCLSQSKDPQTCMTQVMSCVQKSF